MLRGGGQSQGPATAPSSPLHPSYWEGLIQPLMAGRGSRLGALWRGYLRAGGCYWGSKNTTEEEEEEEGSVLELCLALQPLCAQGSG